MPTIARDEGAARRNVRAIALLWRREITRLRHHPIRIFMGMVTPLMFLIVLGTGLDAASGATGAELRNYRTWLFPGVLIMSVQAPAIAVGISIVWDRQRGLLRQMLVAPVHRATIVVGLCVGGSTSGAIYGLMVLAIAGFAGIPYRPALLGVLGETLLIAMAFTAFGVLAAVTIRSVETFQVVMGLCMMPLMFLSGAMFSPNGLPGWLGFAVKINPLTYAVDAVRRTLPTGAGARQSDPLQIFDWTPPIVLELGTLTALTALAMAVAAYRFSRSE